MCYTGSHCGGVESGGIALCHLIAHKAHLGGAVNLVQDQPGVIAAQVVLNVLLQHEPAGRHQGPVGQHAACYP